MQQFTPAQYVLIDAAVQLGYDKETWKERLEIGRGILNNIKEKGLACINEYSPDSKALFTKACSAIQDIIDGKPTGHIIGLDVSSSGPAILSTLLHCETGMHNTGVTNRDTVPNFYQTIADNFDSDVPRDQVKKATVPFVYGSDAAPERIFGDDVPAFTRAYKRTAPEAYWARQVLLNAWNPKALNYSVTTPDGHTAYIEIRDVVDTKGSLGDFTYTYRSAENKPVKQGRSIPANITHTYDGFIYRELSGRCNYDDGQLIYVIECIEGGHCSVACNPTLRKLCKLWERHGFLSVEGLEHVNYMELAGVSKEYLSALAELAKELLEYPSFPVVGVHDEFKCSPIHTQEMRKKYNQIMAESYKCTWLLDVIYDLTGMECEWEEPTKEEVYEAILEADYGVN